MKRCALYTAAGILAAPAAVQAVNVVFTLTGTSTTSLASATINPGVNFDGVQQSAGSLGPRTVTGSITVNVNNVAAPTSIQFISATLDPANFGTPVQPGIGGTAGSAPGEFGFQFDLAAIGAGMEFAAWRDSITTLTSGTLTVNGSGNYSGAGVSFAPIAGTVDFGGATNGTGNLNILAPAANVSATTGSYTVAGTTATLTLPGFDYTYITNFAGTPGTIHFTGSLTGAATVVPEPSLPALFSGASFLLLLRRKRQ